MRLILFISLLGLVACAKNHDEPEAPIAAESCSSSVYNSGTHEFLDGTLEVVDAYDCGTQNGQRCFRFVGTQTEVRCN